RHRATSHWLRSGHGDRPAVRRHQEPAGGDRLPRRRGASGDPDRQPAQGVPAGGQASRPAGVNALLDRARLLTTAGASDAMDRLGIAGQVAGVRPVDPSFRLCGPAFTVKYRPVEVVGETVGDYVDDVPPGSVVVIA